MIAHSGKPGMDTRPHGLREHLRDVAALAEGFADPFDSGHWGQLAGLWHDIGKAARCFQEYLRGQTSRGGDHKHAGALHAIEVLGARLGSPLGLAVAGHHYGLPNPQDMNAHLEDENIASNLAEARKNLGAHVRSAGKMLLPRFLVPGAEPDRNRQRRLKRDIEFWIRMLYSCLVDADFLDTEAYFDPRGSRQRRVAFSLGNLTRSLDPFLDNMTHSAAHTDVNRVRAECLTACREAAELTPGFFSLTVPTGGGKTYSALSFALRHAVRHGLHRVVTVIPFTSIIEQTVAAYRRALPHEAVIEHHSNLDPEKETNWNRLASENWDAPIVVTTGVQFFESLFSNKPSRCRKLHNIARSVVILDEVQTLPPTMRSPILEALDELTRHYGCSVVFCTATQPALRRRDRFPEGLEGIQEIIPQPCKAFEVLSRRVEVTWPRDVDGPESWEGLADRLRGEGRALVIVHRRDDAKRLASLLGEDAFHLSARMCAAHRRAVFESMKRRLSDPAAVCRAVSTQLVEAGVDIDFPVVFRALGGLDSLAQAAGRCNREGKLPGAGRFEVFVAPSSPPRGVPQRGLAVAMEMLESNAARGRELDLHDPEAYTDYFKRFYFGIDPDAGGINALRVELKFPEVACKFRIIPESGEPVVVPFGDSRERIKTHAERPSRRTLRALQPFVVNTYRREFEALLNAGALDNNDGRGVYVLSDAYAHLYDARFGLLVEEGAFADPEGFVV